MCKIKRAGLKHSLLLEGRELTVEGNQGLLLTIMIHKLTHHATETEREMEASRYSDLVDSILKNDALLYQSNIVDSIPSLPFEESEPLRLYVCLVVDEGTTDLKLVTQSSKHIKTAEEQARTIILMITTEIVLNMQGKGRKNKLIKDTLMQAQKVCYRMEKEDKIKITKIEGKKNV